MDVKLLGRQAALATVAVSCTWSLFVGAASAQISTVIEKGDASPSPGSQYRVVRHPSVADAVPPVVAFRAKIKGGLGRRGIFTEDTGGTGTTLATDALVTASDGRLFRRFDRPSLEPGASTAIWRAEVTGAGKGIFRSGLTDVARTGNFIPSVPGQLQEFGYLPQAAAVGDAVFYATVFNGPLVGGVPLVEGIFRCSGGDGDCNVGTGVLTELVVTNTALPDRPGRSICTLGDNISVSSVGVVFRGATKLDCTDVGETSLDGVFRLLFAGAIETVALVGDPPDPVVFPGAMMYERFNDVPSIANDGTVAFEGRVEGVVRTDAVFRCDPAPACPATAAVVAIQAGQTDADVNVLSRFDAVGVTDVGDVVFRCRAKGPSAKGSSLYAHRKATGVFEKIATKGTIFGGKLIKRVGRPAVSPAGRVAFRATTRDAGGGRLGIYLFE